MKPIVIEDFFEEKTYNSIHYYTNTAQFTVEYHDEFKREYVHNNLFFVGIHQYLENVACEIFKTKVKPSYCFLSLYGNEGIVKEHTDRPPCKYTIDFCIDCDKEWDIFIDDTAYTSNLNNAICYSGTDSKHYRNKIEGSFMKLILFHFVPIDYKGPLS